MQLMNPKTTSAYIETMRAQTRWDNRLNLTCDVVLYILIQKFTINLIFPQTHDDTTVGLP